MTLYFILFLFLFHVPSPHQETHVKWYDRVLNYWSRGLSPAVQMETRKQYQWSTFQRTMLVHFEPSGVRWGLNLNVNFLCDRCTRAPPGSIPVPLHFTHIPQYLFHFFLWVKYLEISCIWLESHTRFLSILVRGQ